RYYVRVPMVNRLTGTNQEDGRRILAEAGLNKVETMSEAAQSVVAAATGQSGGFHQGRGTTMRIRVNRDTRELDRGITGREGTFHTGQMVEYGTNVVAGVTPGRGGSAVHGVPVFNTVKEAVGESGANTSIIYVPARFAPDAILEAADAGIELIICITENIPVNEMIKVRDHVVNTGSRLIGPNSPGVITPGEAKVGIMPAYIHERGRVGLVSRSGTLTYEVVWALTEAGLGQTTAVGIGGDPI